MIKKLIPPMALLITLLATAAFAQVPGRSVESLSNADITDTQEPSAEAPAEAPASEPNDPAPTPVETDSPIYQSTDAAPDPADDPTDLIGRVNAELDGNTDAAAAPDRELFAREGSRGTAEAALRTILGLLIVLALILFLYYGLRRWGKRVPLLAGANLGAILGRMHLERGTTLHFVRTGGRVLIIGSNANHISLLANLDPAQFDQADTLPEATDAQDFNPDTFLAQLQANSQAMSGDQPAVDPTLVDDDEIASLRGDIQRLQTYLREESRETRD